MGFKDKAKEVIDNVVEKAKDPDGSLVEKTWPAGEAPATKEQDRPAEGFDPDMDSSTSDQYDQD